MSKMLNRSDKTERSQKKETEPEKAVWFVQASEDELKKRVILKARRRVIRTDCATGSGSGGSKGFSTVTSTQAIAKPVYGASRFSLFSNISKPMIGTASATAASPGASLISNVTTPALGSSIFAFANPNRNAASLKALNQSVADWISDKVKENPLCKLTPIFKDYEKYLSKIEAEKYKVESMELHRLPELHTTSPVKSGFTYGSVSPVSRSVTTTAPFIFGTYTSPSRTSEPRQFPDAKKLSVGDLEPTPNVDDCIAELFELLKKYKPM